LDAMTEFTDEELPMRLGVSQPQQGANRADEFQGLYWFGQISVRDVLETGNIIHGRRQRGRGLQHKQASVLTLDELTKLQSSHVGKLNVDDGKLYGICGDRRYGGRRACRRVHAISQCGKLTSFAKAARLIAVDDQDGHALYPICLCPLTPSCFRSISNEADWCGFLPDRGSPPAPHARARRC